tara:strand:+ start:364 stop:618 length:255 start_codon:yes stop_codon:yes gene_type:complete
MTWKDEIKKNYLQSNYGLILRLEKHLNMLKVAVNVYNRELASDDYNDNQRDMAYDMSREYERAMEVIDELKTNARKTDKDSAEK